MASPTTIMFSKFNVTHAVFHLTPLTFAIVNLKPLLPGHVLVCPRRITPRLYDLSPTELHDMFGVVQRVSRMLERVYGASALNVAMQDGRAAGQSVPHVHAHLIPRKDGDLPEDGIYPLLEGKEGDVGGHWIEEAWRRYEVGRQRAVFEKVPEEERGLRSEEAMRAEAERLRGEMERDEDGEGGGGGAAL